MLDFKVNKFITLRLEDGNSNIYVNNKLFKECKYILVKSKVENLIEISKIKSVDELAEFSVDVIAEKLNHVLEHDEIEEIDIPAEVRFWAHCSNLQTWAENNYNTKLIHSNLSFPLLKKLVGVGDLKAKKVFKEEIIKRFLNGTKGVQEFLLRQGYVELINNEEKNSLLLLEEEEEVINELERLTGKTLHIDTKYHHFNQSFVLRKGKISELNVIDCGINEVPKAIKRLKYLEALRLSGNPINTLPNWIGDLENLKTLEIRSGINKLPETIGNIKSLEKLDLRLNKLVTLPVSLSNLSSLKELNLSNCGLKFLPESIGDLKSLRKFIAFNNELNSLPESIGNLSSLEELDLRYNKLTMIPKSIGNLKSLLSLDLHDNYIKKLPDTIGNLTLIKKINLSKNSLNRIPNSIEKLKNLLNLNIGDNKIKILPNSIGALTSLIKLDCRENQIEKLPNSICKLQELKELRLSSNNISDLPACIGEIKSLEVLSLNNNPIKQLPIEITNLKNLRHLYLERTRISDSEITWLKSRLKHEWVIKKNTLRKTKRKRVRSQTLTI